MVQMKEQRQHGRHVDQRDRSEPEAAKHHVINVARTVNYRVRYYVGCDSERELEEVVDEERDEQDSRPDHGLDLQR